jgi:hypothetical protein
MENIKHAKPLNCANEHKNVFFSLLLNGNTSARITNIVNNT